MLQSPSNEPAKDSDSSQCGWYSDSSDNLRSSIILQVDIGVLRGSSHLLCILYIHNLTNGAEEKTRRAPS